MKALVWQGPERMSIEEMPAPVAERGMVIIRPEAVGICGSEIEGYLGRMGNRQPPLVMGHEFAGTVAEVGEGVSGELVGRRVAVNPLVSCGICSLCRAGRTNVCPNRWLVGIQKPGAFAEYVSAPVANAVPLPQGATAPAGALAEPLANGIHAVRLGQEMGPVEHTVIIGAGAIGALTLQAAILSGTAEVVVVESHEGRRRQAEQLGATRTFASGEEARDAVKHETNGLGADLVIDCVGAVSTRSLAVDLLRPAGCAVMIGLHEDQSTLPFHHLIRNEIIIRGSFAYTQPDYEEALDVLTRAEAGIGDAYMELPLERGPEMFAELARGPMRQVKIFLYPATP